MGSFSYQERRSVILIGIFWSAPSLTCSGVGDPAGVLVKRGDPASVLVAHE
jgi:hypothetical protein